MVQLGPHLADGVAVIDLFAGAGGLSLGAATAGGRLRLSVELDPVACDTLRRNFPDHPVAQLDVQALSGKDLRKRAGLRARDPLVIVGGPPCQPFSKAAYWTEAGEDAAYRRARARGESVERPPAPTEPRPDGRRTLVEEFVRLVLEAKADGFLFENVPSIAHPRNRPMLDALLNDFVDAGFKVHMVRANAVSFGVAQSRERVFVLGARAATPKEPLPTHSTTPERVAGRHAMPTAGAACERFKSRKFAEPEEIVRGRWADHLRTVPPGWNYKAHTAWGGHPKPSFETETRFWNFLLKLDPKLPSWTIPASPGPWTGPFHWTSRRLRTPELAALQGFPASFEFCGTRRDRVRQIGNAVPPPVARAMVGEILSVVASSGA